MPANPDLIPIKREHGDGYHYVLVNRDTGDTACTCPGFERWGHCWASDYVKETEMAETTREIATIDARPLAALQPPADELTAMIDLSDRLYKSAAKPEWVKSEADMLTLMLKAWEMNVSYTTAMQHISLVNGVIQQDAQLMAAICMVNEPDITFEITKEDATSTTIRLTRPSKGYVKEFQYTDQMAKDANLINKGAWVGHKPVMRQWAAIKRLARVYCPDLINGVRPRVGLNDELPSPAGIALPPEDPEAHDPNAYEAEYSISAPAEGSEAEPEAPAAQVSDVPTTTEEQLAMIRDWNEAIREKHGQSGLDKVRAAAQERWPYTGSEFTWTKLTETDAAAFIALLKSIHESKDGNPASLGL